MLKYIFCILILWYVFYSQVYAGLIDSLAVVNNKNATIGEGLPKKKNETSKYDYLKKKNEKPLETAIDAHKPINFKLQEAAKPKMDVNKLSEKQLEAIGDAAIAEKISENTRTTTKPKSTTKKAFDFDKCDDSIL